MDNELELLDDYIVEDDIPADIEKQLILTLFDSLDKLLIAQQEFTELMSMSTIANVVSKSFTASNNYANYLDYCQKNMEM